MQKTAYTGADIIVLWERRCVTGSLKRVDLACAGQPALAWSLQDSWMLPEVQLSFLLSIKCGINDYL